MDIKDIKQIAAEYLAKVRIFALEYCATKTVLIAALSSILFSTVVLFNSTPVFHITSIVLPVNETQSQNNNATQFADLLSINYNPTAPTTKFSSSVKSTDTAIMLWEKWGLKIFNSDPKNKDPDKIIQEHKS